MERAEAGKQRGGGVGGGRWEVGCGRGMEMEGG